MLTPLVSYLQQNPIVAAVLAALAVCFVFSIIKKLIKYALLAGLVLLVSLFFTHRRAMTQWEKQGQRLVIEAQEKAGQYGEKAKKKAEKYGEKARQKAEQLGEEARQKAGQLGEETLQKGKDILLEQPSETETEIPDQGG
jgi:vacuolar-type H+-ATPase subunit H